MRHLRSVWTLAAVSVFSAVITSQTPSGHAVFEQALARERIDGNLQEAIRLYERVVTDFASDRALAAKALVQVGLCYEKLGRDEAVKAYERLVRDFADQESAVAHARARLAALTKATAPAATPARRLVVDWKSGGRSGSPARPTRDGRHLLRYDGDHRAFELVEIGTSNVRRLTSDGPNPAEALVDANRAELSTDGRKLAAVVKIRKPGAAAARPESGELFERAELRVFDVGARGGGRVLRTEHDPAAGDIAAPFGWSPRNDRVWLWLLRSDGSAQISSVDMSGRLQVLKTLTWRDHTQPPSLSPDGRFLAYHDATDRQSRPDLYIIATDGSRGERVEHPADDSKPMFVPDGSGVVFESNRRGARDLWFLAVNDGRPSGQPRLVWRDVEPFGQVERFTETGSLLFYFLVNDWGIHTVPLDLKSTPPSFGDAVRLTPMANEANTGPEFSPDGRYLAYFRARAARLVIRELATGREREVPFGGQLGLYARADWCSSGDAVIAAGRIAGTGWVTYRVNVNDLSVQRLPIAPYDAVLCVGNGEEIIYRPATQTGMPGPITRRSLASGRETTLFEGITHALARSMDGRRLAFVTTDPNREVARLVTMSATGGDISAEVMTSGVLQKRYPHMVAVIWKPGGDGLLVVRFDDGPPPANPMQPPPLWVWDVPFGGGSPRKLGSLPLPKAEGTFVPPWVFSLHPDGKRLAFQSHEGLVQQTWALDNLFQFIKAGGGS